MAKSPRRQNKRISGRAPCSLGKFLEEFCDHGGSLSGEFVFAGMNECHDRRAGFGWIKRAMLGPRLSFGVTTVEFADRFDCTLLPFEFNERIVFAGNVQQRLWLELEQALGGEPGAGRPRGKCVPSFAP